MKKEEKYSIVASTFLGSDKNGLHKYEITFNKSLQHIGRFKGMEDGLNAYCRKERRTDVADNFKRLWRSFVKWITNLI
jgi:hypothetical protein